MAVFSNLEGTMKKSFVIGKGGAKLVFQNGALRLMNYNESDLVPISVAAPTDDTHAVNLAYFNAHNGSGGGNSTILHGIDTPLPSLGEDSNVYFKIDATSILGIYFKDDGIWKPYASTPPVQDSEYVTTYTVTPTDWTLSNSVYKYQLPASAHERGDNIVVQLQDVDGSVNMDDVVVDGLGNITVSTNIQPTSSVNILIIGATTMSTPYSNPINKSNWSTVGDHFEFSIPASTHNQATGPLFITVYQNTVDGNTSASPFIIVGLETAIDTSGNITLKSNITFSGKVVISGK